MGAMIRAYVDTPARIMFLTGCETRQRTWLRAVSHRHPPPIWGALLLSYGTGRNMQVRTHGSIRLLPARHTHETHVGHAGFRRAFSTARLVELPRIELGSGLPSATACHHVHIRRLMLIRGRVRSANPRGL